MSEELNRSQERLDDLRQRLVSIADRSEEQDIVTNPFADSEIFPANISTARLPELATEFLLYTGTIKPEDSDLTTEVIGSFEDEFDGLSSVVKRHYKTIFAGSDLDRYVNQLNAETKDYFKADSWEPNLIYMRMLLAYIVSRYQESQ